MGYSYATKWVSLFYVFDELEGSENNEEKSNDRR